MTRIALFALVAAFTVSALPASANSWGDRAKPKDPTLQMIERKIERGKRSGELTVREVKVLEAEGRRLVTLKRKAMSDGVLTRREYKKVRTAEKKLIEFIDRELHDKERRFRGKKRTPEPSSRRR